MGPQEQRAERLWPMGDDDLDRTVGVCARSRSVRAVQGVEYAERGVGQVVHPASVPGCHPHAQAGVCSHLGEHVPPSSPFRILLRFTGSRQRWAHRPGVGRRAHVRRFRHHDAVHPVRTQCGDEVAPLRVRRRGELLRDCGHGYILRGRAGHQRPDRLLQPRHEHQYFQVVDVRTPHQPH